jgi:hypothetical protein
MGGHVVRSGNARNTYRVSVGNCEGKEHLVKLDVDGRSVLNT